MKKNDIILIAVIMIIAVPLVIMLLTRQSGDKVIIKSDGKVIDEISLNKNITRTYETDFGINEIEIKDKKVRVIEADCPGKDCIHKGFINRNNEIIVCLPHRFEVSISTGKEDYDVIVE